MTARTSTIEYASRATYGNVAYDYERAMPRPGWKEIPVPQQLEEQQKNAARKRARAEAQEPETRVISAFSVIGLIAVAVMMIFVLLAYVQLTEVSAETAQLQSQLRELNEEKVQAKVAYENTFNLTEVEEYAINVLGMTRASDGQKFDLEVSAEDKAVVLDYTSRMDTGEITYGVSEFLGTVLSYFK